MRGEEQAPLEFSTVGRPSPEDRHGAPPAAARRDRGPEFYLRNKNRWLVGEVEDLERRLRRRTVALGCALAASVGLTAALAAFAFADLPFATSVWRALPVAWTGSAPSMADPRDQPLVRLELRDEPGASALPVGNLNGSPSAGSTEPISTTPAHEPSGAPIQMLSAREPAPESAPPLEASTRAAPGHGRR